jgi:hypothetical protein
MSEAMKPEAGIWIESGNGTEFLPMGKIADRMRRDFEDRYDIPDEDNLDSLEE